jgi:hypothetical protein
MGQYKASKWSNKIAKKRAPIEGGKSRKLPFTLSELHCKDQSRAIEKIRSKIGMNLQF